MNESFHCRLLASSCEGGKGCFTSAPTCSTILALWPRDGSSAGLLFEGILVGHKLKEKVALSNHYTDSRDYVPHPNHSHNTSYRTFFDWGRRAWHLRLGLGFAHARVKLNTVWNYGTYRELANATIKATTLCALWCWVVWAGSATILKRHMCWQWVCLQTHFKNFLQCMSKEHVVTELSLVSVPASHTFGCSTKALICKAQDTYVPHPNHSA